MSQELSWNEWLSHNIARDCAPDVLRAELIKNGFSTAQANEKLLLANAELENKKRQFASFAPVAGNQAVYLPNAIKIENDQVELYGVDGFLSADENMQLIELIRNNRRKSTTTEEGVSSFRTSTTCELASLEHPLVKEIDERICRYIGIEPNQSEPIEGQWYEVGQEFKAHTDYFDPSSESYDHHIGDLGQRTWTFMIYLNSTRDGGETYFSELDINIEPIAGTAIVWNNVGPDGQMNSATLHHGMPVKSGFKAIITKWFRSVNGQARYNKEANERLKPLTKSGFLKHTMPEPLFNTLSAFYRDQRDHAMSESIPDFITNMAGEQPSVLIELTDELKQSVHESLQPMVEAWVGDYLHPTYVYGIREYQKGAQLKAHRDRIKTHVASVILNIDQDVQSDWPLVIEDHFYRRHHIVLKPGEMVFYEGARLQHGRPDALDGQRYANVFVHFNKT